VLVDAASQLTAFFRGAGLEYSLRMKTSIICERAFEFASRILKLCDRLYQAGPVGRHLAEELMDCETSVGANAEEAEEGQSKADFIAKLSISRKEARESNYWLRLAVKTGIVGGDDVQWELSESRQLVAMIRSAILTARSSPDRGSR
jgi:four helix bundle protein